VGHLLRCRHEWYGLSQQKQVGVTQQGQRATETVALVFEPLQTLRSVGVHDLVGTLIRIPGDLQHFSVRFAFTEQGQKLTTAAFYGTGTALAEVPEVVGLTEEYSESV
jgi:hypothetical protein